MSAVVAIVEGDGEVAALPVLLRRLNDWLTPGRFVQVPTPIRVRRERFLNRDDEFRRHLLFAAAKCGDQGWILILLDADDDCPADQGPGILQKAQQLIPHRRISVVLANREYEAWFIAGARSLSGKRGFRMDDAEEIVDAETPRDAKGWLKRHMASRSYGETTDQPAFSSLVDLRLVHERSRSFRKLCSEWRKQLPVDES